MPKPNPMMDFHDLYNEVRRLTRLRDKIRDREKLNAKIEEVAAMAHYAYLLNRSRDN